MSNNGCVAVTSRKSKRGVSVIRSAFGQLSSLVIALVFAIIVWGVATDKENPSRLALYPDQLPIEIVNRADGLMVFQQTVDKVRVTLRAPQANWDALRPTSFSVTADLQGLDAGSQQVQLQVRVSDPRVSVVEIDPKTVGIRLERVKSRDFDIRSDVLDAVPLGYIYQAPVLTPAQVTISGPAILVDQVTEVSADVYLRGTKTLVEREVTVQARDAQGNPVLGVTITPPTTMVKVQVEQRVGYKDVSIKTVLKGTVAPGYWVSNILVSPTTATIAGNPDVMAKIAGYIETVPIDVNGATADLSKKATLSLPEGVSVLNNEGVTVQVSVTPILGGQTIRRKVSLQGLRRGATATVSPDTVEVILSGPLPSLQALTADDIQITLDVTGLASGTHQLKPRVSQIPGALRVQNLVPDTIQVIVVDPTPTATASPSITPSPIPTLTATPTLVAPSIPTAIPTPR